MSNFSSHLDEQAWKSIFCESLLRLRPLLERRTAEALMLTAWLNGGRLRPEEVAEFVVVRIP